MRKHRHRATRGRVTVDIEPRPAVLGQVPLTIEGLLVQMEDGAGAYAIAIANHSGYQIDISADCQLITIPPHGKATFMSTMRFDWEEHSREAAGRRCRHCGNELGDTHAGRLYCSDSCKQKAYRADRKIQAGENGPIHERMRWRTDEAIQALNAELGRLQSEAGHRFGHETASEGQTRQVIEQAVKRLRQARNQK